MEVFKESGLLDAGPILVASAEDSYYNINNYQAKE